MVMKEIETDDPSRIHRLKPEKDDTDTLAAVREGLERGYRKFYFYGALGGRLDHSIANIQTLLFLKKQGAVGYILTERQLVTVIRNEEITFHTGVEGIPWQKLRGQTTSPLESAMNLSKAKKHK